MQPQALEIQTTAASEKLIAEVNGKRFEILVHAPEPVVKRHRAKAAKLCSWRYWRCSLKPYARHCG
jgi:hypothetical protein